jgi:CubicO group peptidase (beta-lactamase class C family)
LAWNILQYGSGTLVWHNGGTGGFNTFLGFVKEKRAGVCVLTNRSPSLLSAVGLGPPLAEGFASPILKSLSNGAA